MPEAVYLAVYDISMGMARQMSQALLGQQIDGIWHTGVCVYGREYFFGGGIQSLPSGHFSAQNGMQPVQMLELGQTEIDRETFEAYLREINSRFTQQTYNLLTNNCNNFSDTCTRFLLGRGIPDDIINLPQRALSTPMGQMLRPMFEQIQNASNMDPFGAAQFSTPIPAPGRAAVPAPNTHTYTQMSPEAALQAIRTYLAQNDKPLLSSNASTTASIAKKLIADDALTQEEKAQVSELARSLATGEECPAGFALISSMLHKIDMNRASVSVFFLLRLLVLNDANWAAASNPNPNPIECLDVMVAGLTSRTLPHPARVMAMCVVANMYACQRGKQYVSEREEQLLDIATAELGSERVEMRQIASALLSNICLELSQTQTYTHTGGELPAAVVQILCVCFEGLAAETDATVKLRRTLCISRLVSAYTQTAVQLIKDLELAPTIVSVCGDAEPSSAIHTITQALSALLTQ